MQATEQLAELIRKKHQVLVQLRDIGRRQTDLVSGGEIAALLKLLAGKQHLIAALQELGTRAETLLRREPRDARVANAGRSHSMCGNGD